MYVCIYMYIYLSIYNGCIVWECVRRNEEKREERNNDKTEEWKEAK